MIINNFQKFIALIIVVVVHFLCCLLFLRDYDCRNTDDLLVSVGNSEKMSFVIKGIGLSKLSDLSLPANSYIHKSDRPDALLETQVNDALLQQHSGEPIAYDQFPQNQSSDLIERNNLVLAEKEANSKDKKSELVEKEADSKDKKSELEEKKDDSKDKELELTEKKDIKKDTNSSNQSNKKLEQAQHKEKVESKHQNTLEQQSKGEKVSSSYDKLTNNPIEISENNLAKIGNGQSSEESSSTNDTVSGKNYGTEVAFSRLKIIYRPNFVYPNQARRFGYEGIVVLFLSVANDGTVSSVRLHKSSGYQILDSSAVSFAQKIRFSPESVQKAGTNIIVKLPVNYRLK